MNEFPDDGTIRILIGSRVKILDPRYQNEIGRAIKVKSNGQEMEIERENKRNNVGVPHQNLEPLYQGAKNHIDIMLWKLENKTRELEMILKGSFLPEYFLERDLVNVKIVGRSVVELEYCFAICEIFKFNPVQQIKVPAKFIQSGDFYQIQIKDGIITNILPISIERYQGLE